MSEKLEKGFILDHKPIIGIFFVEIHLLFQFFQAGKLPHRAYKRFQLHADGFTVSVGLMRKHECFAQARPGNIAYRGMPYPAQLCAAQVHARRRAYDRVG